MLGKITPLIKYQSPSIIWGLFILLLLLLPGSNVEIILLFEIVPADKFVHFFLFMLLSIFNTVGWFKLFKAFNSNVRKYVLTMITCGVFAGITESLQLIISTQRQADWFDFLTNLIGIFAGILVFKIIYKK